MDVLVLGGSVFLGRAVVGAALARGDRVTVFNRGVSAPPPDGVTHVAGDRTVADDLARLSGTHFDVVVDTCGYVPADVALSADLLANSCDRYVFVSSVNAYPGWPVDAAYRERGAHAGDPDATRDDVPDGVADEQEYGWLKVGCELAAARAFGSARTTVVRAGGIVGPDDSAVGRLPWWIDRVARGGEVLVPGAPGDPIAVIDSRDLARFALSGAAGTFEAGGPAGRDTWADLLAGCVAVTGSAATFTHVDGEWLQAQGVAAWTEVPLWIPASQAPGRRAHDNAAAEAAGLRWRAIAETVRDTWAWQRAVPGGWRPTARTPGLAAARERELLDAWHAR